MKTILLSLLLCTAAWADSPDVDVVQHAIMQQTNKTRAYLKSQAVAAQTLAARRQALRSLRDLQPMLPNCPIPFRVGQFGYLDEIGLGPDDGPGRAGTYLATARFQVGTRRPWDATVMPADMLWLYVQESRPIYDEQPVVLKGFGVLPSDGKALTVRQWVWVTDVSGGIATIEPLDPSEYLTPDFLLELGIVLR